jgi:hypothetical protein
VEVEGVGTVSVLNENNYSMQQGGISVAHKARAKDQPKKSRLQVRESAAHARGLRVEPTLAPIRSASSISTTATWTRP